MSTALHGVLHKFWQVLKVLSHFHDFNTGPDCAQIMVNESVTGGVLLIIDSYVNANLSNTQLLTVISSVLFLYLGLHVSIGLFIKQVCPQ